MTAEKGKKRRSPAATPAAAVSDACQAWRLRLPRATPLCEGEKWVPNVLAKIAHSSWTAGRLSLTVRGPSVSAVRLRPLAGIPVHTTWRLLPGERRYPNCLATSVVRDTGCVPLFFFSARGFDEETAVSLPAQCWLLGSP